MNNNPLSYTDPSGYFLKKLFKNKVFRIAVGIAIGITTQQLYLTQGFIGGAIGAGAAGGFAGSLVGSGGNLKSAVIGGVTGGLAGAIGQTFPTAPGTFASPQAIAAHSALGCASAAIGGGDCGSSALAGGFTKITSPYIAEFAGATTFSEKFTGAVLAGAVGGTVSEMTGGKFSNGAITGAYAYLYNQAMEGYARQQALRHGPCSTPTASCQNHNALYQSAVDERARLEAIEPIAPEFELIGAGVAARGVWRGYSIGKEFKLGGDLRLAPFGNRTGHKFGELPHYHRRVTDPTRMQTLPGQGISRHRPWEIKSTDNSFWDRF